MLIFNDNLPTIGDRECLFDLPDSMGKMFAMKSIIGDKTLSIKLFLASWSKLEAKDLNWNNDIAKIHTNMNTPMEDPKPNFSCWNPLYIIYTTIDLAWVGTSLPLYITNTSSNIWN